MLKPSDIRVNRQRMGHYDREHIAEGGEMVFSWALDTDRPEANQAAYRVLVSDRELNDLFDSGWVETARQECRLTESGWPRGEALTVCVILRDSLGREGEGEEYFYLGDVEWDAEWIAADADVGEAAVYLRKEFTIDKPFARRRYTPAASAIRSCT